MRTKLFALYAAVGLVLVAAGPGLAAAADDGAGNTALSVAVNQPGDGAPTVSVTDNGTGVDGAAVSVVGLDNYSYVGVGDYTTDENGTVSLPEPQENGTIAVTATVDNYTVATTANLTAAEEENESFGSEMSAFVHTLLMNNPSGGIGHSVATFATMNNPGNAPDHAGPPWMDDDGDDERGPPAHAGPGGDEDSERGPPEHVESDDNETDERGPPAHAGPGNGDDTESEDEEDSDDGEESDDDSEDTDGEETDAEESDDDSETEDEDTETADNEDDDDRRGPPGGNGPPGQAGR
ncbi:MULTISPECIES: hypothetical protein [Salinibaculum]|uniref:hypothetical protein n=1 Tax=Salinibaculum TaxID=2732368 RepID=UPI0030D58318